MNKDKLKLIQSTQAFSPIREIKDGIICTKSGRYIKLLEFSPVNFSLRGADEQAQIVSQFAMVLRTLPSNVQIKVVQRRADVSKILDVLQSHYNEETCPKCQRLQLEQMQMIQDIGSVQGVSRRFFLAWKYEDQANWGVHKAPSWERILREMDETEMSVRNTMEACGNECLTPRHSDSWVLETLYFIFSRSQAERTPYSTREFATVARYASQQGYDFEHNNYVLPTNDLICPQLIDDGASPNYLVIQGSADSAPLYYTFAYIPGRDYPRGCIAGWANILINTAPGIDVDIYCHKEDPERIARRLSFTIRSKRATAKNADDSRADYDELIESIGSGYYIKQGISSNEDVYNFGILVTITAYTAEELNERYQLLKQHLGKRELGLKRCTFSQLAALKMSLPLATYDKNIFDKAKRNILGSQLAAIYPFSSYEMSDDNGVLLGIQDNGSLVLLDNFDTSKYNNANMCILGSAGAGKTYLLQGMALRFREKQIQTFVIVPEKGNEFKRACDAVGGQFITIAPGSKQNINIMEIRKKESDASAILDGDAETTGSILAEKIQSLHVFMSLLCPEMTYSERQILDEVFLRTYAKFGITLENDSLDDPENPGHYKPMPVLKDLYDELSKVEEARQICSAVKRYISGSAKSFSGPTNVDLHNKYIVLDVSRMTDEFLPIGMYIALDYVWDKVREDRTAKKIIFMDEGWKLCGASASPLAAKFATLVFKTIRGYGGSAVMATQELNDLMALNRGEFGNAIINNSKIKIIMKTGRKELEAIQGVFDLTQAEREAIIATKRGSGLLIANSDHVFIRIQASRTEHDLITTDRVDLARIVREKTASRAYNEA